MISGEQTLTDSLKQTMSVLKQLVDKERDFLYYYANKAGENIQEEIGGVILEVACILHSILRKSYVSKWFRKNISPVFT